MSLRTRLLAAFAYVLVLVIVALLVPLALNLSRRVDAEIRSEARGQAQLLAALRLGPAGRAQRARAPRARLPRSDLGGRVIVVGPRGRLLADSEARACESSLLRHPARGRSGAARATPTQGERHSDSLDEDLLFTAVPVVNAGRTEGAVRVTQSVDASTPRCASDTIALIGVGGGRAAARARARLAAGRLAGPAAARPRGHGAPGRRRRSRRARSAWRVVGAARGGVGLQRHDRRGSRARCARSASSWPTPRTSCARR